MTKETALQVALKHCRDKNYSATLPDIVPVDFGVGLKFKDDKDRFNLGGSPPGSR